MLWGTNLSNEIDEFHRWLGMCISQWAHVENRLFFICWKCMRSSIDIAAAVFYQHRSVTNQLRLTAELVRANMGQGIACHSDYSEWQVIAGKIERSLVPVRNRIAHQPVVAQLADDVSGFEVSLQMAFAETMRPGNKNPDPLRLAELQAHVIAVQAIVREMDAFTEKVLPKHID